MQGQVEVIRQLNAVLTNELTAINQYFLHARMYENWGFLRLGKIVYEESIGEMKHADMLIKRILFLDGLPNLQDLGKLRIGESVPEGLASDLNIERMSRDTLVPAVKLTADVGDYVSHDLLKVILADTEEHIDFLETQLSLVRALGEANYLQSAAGELQMYNGAQG